MAWTALALFLGSFLLFCAELIVARMTLPRFGGAPMVWNTTMLFFQTLLLLGYLLADRMARWSPKTQAAGLLALVGLPILTLPFQLPAELDGPAVVVLLASLTLMCGAPILALATCSTLLQAWFARSDHPLRENPYPLYAASNLGSCLALLATPLLFEPLFGLSERSRHWLWLDGLFLLLIAGLALRLVRSRSAANETASPSSDDAGATADERASGVAAGAEAREAGKAEDQSDVTGDPAPTDTATKSGDSGYVRPGAGFQLVASMIPGSLLHGISLHITTDIAAVPLLWVAPLLLYLFTWVIAFLDRAPKLDRVAALLPLGLAAFLVTCLPTTYLLHGRIQLLLILNLGALFVTALVLHTRLARSRPEASELTGFYLRIGLGGWLGGVFNVLSPAIFTDLLELPAILILAGFALWPDLADEAAATRRLRRRLLMFAGAATLAILLVGFVPGRWLARPLEVLALLLLGAGTAFALRRVTPRPVAILVLLALALLPGFAPRVVLDLRYAERSFFGLLRVIDEEGGFRTLLHGTTRHGMQSLKPDDRLAALSYYHARGPIGDVMRQPFARRRVAVLGLGVGGLAAYSRPEDDWTFFEIDPAVIRIARDQSLFHFLSEAHGEVETVLGDARLELAERADRYDLVVGDAFSSDSVPVHLLTVEALALMQSRLRPGGHMLLNITNRYLDLESVVAANAEELGLRALTRFDPENKTRGKAISHWVVLSPQPEGSGAFGTLRELGWRPLQRAEGIAPWTDQSASVLSALKSGSRSSSDSSGK